MPKQIHIDEKGLQLYLKSIRAKIKNKESEVAEDETKPGEEGYNPYA